ncbi:MAG: methyltransferase domain-containing protein [Alphaproteobacteria bacterium]|nr:methyltransferase domain-containing protein [Alphaproteobacteria bacterium]
MRDRPHCPLCRSEGAKASPDLPVEAVRDYWRRFAYDLDAAFPGLPPALHAWRCPACALGWYEPRIAGGASLYAALASWPEYYRKDAWEWPVAIEILASAGIRSLVEIGAGAGAFLDRAAAHFPAVLGLEFNEAAVAAARARNRPVVNRPVESLAEPPDAIAAFQLLEHLADPRHFIATCRDKLGRGGLLVLAVPNDDGAMGMIEGDFLNAPPHHATRWRRASLEAVAPLFGLKLAAYRAQPLDRSLHALYRRRRLRPARTLGGKLANRARRQMLDLASPLVFARDRRRIGGAAHLAVFQKV